MNKNMLLRQVFIRLAICAFCVASVMDALPAGTAFAASLPQDKTSAVAFVYHLVGDEGNSRASVSGDLFNAHIQELVSENYNITSLDKVIEALKSGKELPPRTVVITFDGAWLSTAKNAFAKLNDTGLPYTVFFASDLADQSDPRHMSWKQIKALSKNKNVTLGILPASYAHIVLWSEKERATVINRAVSRFREELGDDPEFFAYTFGEYSKEFKKQVESYGFSAAFGQQSGVMYAGLDTAALPRFTMTDSFGDMERFRLTASALPLPAIDVIPDNPLLAAAETDAAPKLGFTVDPGLTDLGKLSCFASGIGKLKVIRLGKNRIEIRFDTPLTDRKTRVNCTLPEDTADATQQRWRWFGTQFILPEVALSDDEGDETTETEATEADNTDALDEASTQNDIIQP
jgi:peptidoglycan/xylan/chitin deacetylase (PgdA/CDA1 family)